MASPHDVPPGLRHRPVRRRRGERTEGWPAGLRLATLSLAGHPDPEGFAAAFSGTERTVAEYLMVEVLERQPEDMRRLLLRTIVLERINGDLAARLLADHWPGLHLAGQAATAASSAAPASGPPRRPC